MAEERKKEADVFGEDFDLLTEGLEDILTPVEAHEEDTIEETIVDEKEPEVEEDDTLEDVIEKGEDAEESDESKSSSSSPLIPYAKYLKEEGVLPNFDLEKFDGSIDGLREGMYSEIVSGIEAYKQSLPDRVKTIIERYEDGIPFEKLIEIDSNKVKYSSFTDEQLSNEEIQRNLLKEYFSQTTKFSKEKIEKEINRLADLQELEEEAKAVLPELIALQDEEERKAIEQVKIQKEQQEQQRLQELEAVKVAVEEINEIIPGNKISTVMKQKIFKNLTTPVAQTEEGIPVNKLGAYRINNPVKTEIILNYIFEATNEFKDWSVFNKGTKRAVISELENAARNVESQLGSRKSPQSKGASNFLKELDNYDF